VRRHAQKEREGKVGAEFGEPGAGLGRRPGGVVEVAFKEPCDGLLRRVPVRIEIIGERQGAADEIEMGDGDWRRIGLEGLPVGVADLDLPGILAID
jgi:hypothetical protein